MDTFVTNTHTQSIVSTFLVHWSLDRSLLHPLIVLVGRLFIHSFSPQRYDSSTLHFENECSIPVSLVHTAKATAATSALGCLDLVLVLQHKVKRTVVCGLHRPESLLGSTVVLNINGIHSLRTVLGRLAL